MSRYIASLTWDDAPHLSQKEKDEYWAAIPPYQRSARTKGMPILGSGLIYPFDEERLKVTPFDLPRSWPRVIGLDTDAGAGWTAGTALAWDRENKTVYLYRVHKSDARSLAVHVDWVSSVGAAQAPWKPLWIPVVADSAGLRVTEDDAEQTIKLYQDRGVDMTLPDKAVESGIQSVYDLIEASRFKVFSTCGEWFSEFRQYHRKDGVIVKKNDHLMDATRYGIHSGLSLARTAPPAPDATPRVLQYNEGHYGTGWMGM